MPSQCGLSLGFARRLVASGATTVSVSGASTTYRITASDDQVDEADGSVTATVQSGSGYTVGNSSSALVGVADDDAAPDVRDDKTQLIA